MSDQLNRIESKLDSHTDRLGKIEGRLDAVDANLALHMKRTDQNEAEIKSLQKFRWQVLGGVLVVTFLAQLLIKRL